MPSRPLPRHANASEAGSTASFAAAPLRHAMSAGIDVALRPPIPTPGGIQRRAKCAAQRWWQPRAAARADACCYLRTAKGRIYTPRHKRCAQK
jgi:hypothetical protein